MFALIREYLNQTNITQREFCSNHHIAYSTFQLYLSNFRRQQPARKAEPTGQFIPLAFPEQAITTSGHSACEITWPDGMIIRFGTKPSPEYLLALIKAEQSGL
jgi:hypothetical protein